MSENGRQTQKRSEQLALSFSHDPATGRDDLLVSGPVSAAVAIVDNWPAWPSPVIVLAGPAGSGKTHLASIWRDKSGARDIHPLPGQHASRFAADGPVLFEDADRRGFDDTELFHVINSVRENGSSLLMTARTWPSAWGVTLPDLRSRLKAATIVEIGEPDEDLLAQVIVKLFADRQLNIDDKIVAYIVARMERSLAAAQHIVERIDRLALSRGTRINRSLAAEVLESFGEERGVDEAEG
ncbi:DnaA regulatory inactivator HdaA [Neorhizobium sp. NPDC001467]|uniref:DnaA regulatory inactivator HdaA n=1 Tax=Neorhizobium sp. NPDC001467 TaxID=3390595 RepID=UPI003D04CC3A